MYAKTDSVDGEGRLDGQGVATIDLKNAVSIEPYDKNKGAKEDGKKKKKGKEKDGKKSKDKDKGTPDYDFQRFNIDMGDGGDGKVYKFKAASESEGKVWLKRLQEWKDYAVLADL